MGFATSAGVRGLVLGLLLAVPAGAQQAQQADETPAAHPPDQVTIQEFLPVEGIFGFLVFQEKLTDDQLVDARKVLVDAYEQRAEIASQIQDGNAAPERLKQDLVDLRSGMMEKLSGILNEAQNVSLKQALGVVEADRAGVAPEQSGRR